MDDFRFEIKRENNQVIPCEAFFTFENNNINYVVYTDNKKDQNGDYDILASRYEIKNGKVILSNIETEEEFDLVDKMIEEKMSD